MKTIRRDQAWVITLWTFLIVWIALGLVLFTSGCATTALDPRDPAVFQPANPQYPTPESMIPLPKVTNLTLFPPSATHPIPPKEIGGVAAFGCTLSFTPVPQPPGTSYWFALSLSEFLPPGPRDWTYIPRANPNSKSVEIPIYTLTLLPQFVWVCAGDDNCGVSLTACPINLNTVVAIPAANQTP